MSKPIMEDKGAAMIIDKIDNGQSKKEAKSERVQEDVVLMPTEDSFSAEDTVPFSMTDPQSGREIAQMEALKQCDYSTDVNMEATINPDDVVRAGGFGARDDLSSFLPTASDSTDFEASLLDARDYEECQGEQHRPGLGWSENRVSE
ncbi:uncharacterized protein LOC110691571 [Chenopodium quinoa]|uniref:uncharacterized protein LOC110691571 n=1 Tax=Chenopodium quinoa TaxID=63459 RepID=UPI000B78B9A7|nr:uncharacterized protein LOC110691571 [Chenopodium quinoa]